MIHWLSLSQTGFFVVHVLGLVDVFVQTTSARVGVEGDAIFCSERPKSQSIRLEQRGRLIKKEA